MSGRVQVSEVPLGFGVTQIQKQRLIYQDLFVLHWCKKKEEKKALTGQMKKYIFIMTRRYVAT